MMQFFEADGILITTNSRSFEVSTFMFIAVSYGMSIWRWNFTPYHSIDVSGIAENADERSIISESCQCMYAMWCLQDNFQ